MKKAQGETEDILRRREYNDGSADIESKLILEINTKERRDKKIKIRRHIMTTTPHSLGDRSSSTVRELQEISAYEQVTPTKNGRKWVSYWRK